jgi:hypothetical protein
MATAFDSDAESDCKKFSLTLHALQYGRAPLLLPSEKGKFER